VLSLPSALHIFLAVEPADMRKGFDGLAQLVRERIAEDRKRPAVHTLDAVGDLTPTRLVSPPAPGCVAPRSGRSPTVARSPSG
jgi:IS66 Orf2 like protein